MRILLSFKLIQIKKIVNHATHMINLLLPSHQFSYSLFSYVSRTTSLRVGDVFFEPLFFVGT
jgi:hypothetical protein